MKIVRRVALVLLLGGGSAFAERSALSAPAAGPRNTSVIELNLTVGENKTISAGDVESFTVGVPGFVDLKLTPDKNQFVLSGLRPGSTTVLFIKHNGAEVTYNVTVFNRDPKFVNSELRELLAGYTGLRIKQVSTRFFIEGGVSTEADAKRVGLIASLYPGQVESLVVVGSVGVEHTINVRIDFYFVQYDKSSNYGVGLSWPSRFGGGTSVAVNLDLINHTTSANASTSQLLPALDLAQTRGWAKVLKHSTVVTTSGSEATFNNGGEQNFAVAAGLTGSVQPIKFGTSVTVLPRYDIASHDLEIKVSANVSDLTPPGATTSLPGRRTSDIATFVHLKLGESLVLSGIRTSSQTHSVNGLPGLSEIPVLGLLFGGHTNSVSEIEGAVFVIPSIVESVPRRAYNIVNAAMNIYNNYNADDIAEKPPSFPVQPPNYR
jgi:pilus assembly protein CpaC